MTFLDFPRNDFHKNHKMALSATGLCSDTQQELTAENGETGFTFLVLFGKSCTSFHQLCSVCVCGCGECWAVKEEKGWEMSLGQPKEGH